MITRYVFVCVCDGQSSSQSERMIVLVNSIAEGKAARPHTHVNATCVNAINFMTSKAELEYKLNLKFQKVT